MYNALMRRVKLQLIKLFRIKGNAHEISLGFTVGFLVNFIPSFGMGPILSAAGAKLLKCNPAAGFLGGISLIWLFPFLFYLNIMMGEMFYPDEAGLGIAPGSDAIRYGMHLGESFLIGMLINIILFGILVYFSLLTLIQKYRLTLLSFLKEWEVKK